MLKINKYINYIYHPILQYLESSRAIKCIIVFIYFITALSYSYKYDYKNLDIKLGLMYVVITQFIFFFGNLLNSLIDGHNGIDVNNQYDKTLKKISFKQLQEYIVYTNLVIGLLLFMVYINYDFKIFRITLIYSSILYLLSVIYTPSKYIAMGMIVMAIVHHTMICGIFYSITKEFVAFSYTHPIFLYGIYLSTNGLIGIHSNCHRDIKEDKSVGIVTSSTILGEKKSLLFWWSLFLMRSFIMVLISIIINNYYNLLTLLNYPLMYQHYQKAKNNKLTQDFVEETFKILSISLIILPITILIN